MFRDLKEYQEIQNLYENKVYLAEQEENELIDLMYKSKFDKCDYTNLTGGIVSIHSGWKI